MNRKKIEYFVTNTNLYTTLMPDLNYIGKLDVTINRLMSTLQIKSHYMIKKYPDGNPIGPKDLVIFKRDYPYYILNEVCSFFHHIEYLIYRRYLRHRIEKYRRRLLR